jgi:hypothetical protein
MGRVEIWHNMTIHKKGDVIIRDNYRAVTLLYTTYKHLMNILYVELIPYAEEIIGEYKGGVRRGS